MKAVIFVVFCITGAVAILPSYEDALSNSHDLLKLFRAHSQNNGKLHRHSSEVPMRVNLFRGALKTIVDINNKGLTWTAKLTQFATMSKAERESYLGLNA